VGVSGITGVITEVVKIIILNLTNNPQLTIIISSVFGYIISYIAQRYVFCGGRFIGISLLKFFSVACIGILLYDLLLKWLLNIPKIKEFIEDKQISDTRRKLYQYLLINISIIIIFICFEYPLRKYFIFSKSRSDYMKSYLLFFISIIMYVSLN
jgi:hypothetical protein